MRAVRISVSWIRKSPTALLGARTAQCNAILGDFVTFKHPKLYTAKKANAKNILDKFSVQFFVFFFDLTSSSECS